MVNEKESDYFGLTKHEFCISTDFTEQISEDSFKVRTKTLKADIGTTLGEIESWYRSIKPNGDIEFVVTTLQPIK